MAALENIAMLANEYKKQMVAGWYASEKLDGQRALWLPTTRNKYDLFHSKGLSTGLWSRYGKIINAPRDFLDALPEYPLDGELYLGVGQFEDMRSIVSRKTPDSRWENVKYHVFDIPNPLIHEKPISFEEAQDLIEEAENGTIFKVSQEKVPAYAEQYLERSLKQIVKAGGEGLILRNPNYFWEGRRVQHLLKVKPENDAEAIVLGYTEGKGKHLGRLGALEVSWNGKAFNLSGFTDAERENARVLFPIGSVVTFKYRELTKYGVPKEARYFRRA